MQNSFIYECPSSSNVFKTIIIHCTNSESVNVCKVGSLRIIIKGIYMICRKNVITMMNGQDAGKKFIFDAANANELF